MLSMTFEITGAGPMLMHNSRLANPLDVYTKRLKAVTKKRQKTDEDHEEVALIEAEGSLYYNKQFGVHIPGENIEACLLAAAKFRKMGTTFKRGAQVLDEACPLEYPGPKDPAKLVRDPEFVLGKLVKVGTTRVLRTRPIFREWSTRFAIAFAPDQFNADEIRAIVKDAGELVGLGDWRPRYGRFSVKEV